MAVLEEAAPAAPRPVGPPPGIGGGPHGPAYAPGPTFVTSAYPQHFPGGAVLGAGPGGIMVVSAPAPAPRVVVACPSCGQHLMPPPGAAVFACPCGQLMRPPPMPQPVMMSVVPELEPLGPFGYTPGMVLRQPGAADAAPAKGASSGGPAAVRSGAGAAAGAGAAPRVIQCGRCRVSLSTTTAVTICGACGFRNEPSPHAAAPAPAPIGGGGSGGYPTKTV